MDLYDKFLWYARYDNTLFWSNFVPYAYLYVLTHKYK